MKKLCLWTLLLCLLLTACANNDGTVPGGDMIAAGSVAQNKYIRWSRMFPFVETDSVFYGLLGGRAYYYDRQSGFSDFLCADPSCTHDSVECSSYMQEMADMFTYYDGKLYWLGQTTPKQYASLCLHRCDPDGRNREIVMELDYEETVIEYTPQKWMLYHDKLFFIGVTEVVVGMQALIRNTFGYVPLDGEGEVILLYDEFFKNHSTSGEMLFAGDAAYFAISDGVAGTLAIMQYDLRDNSQEILLSKDKSEWAERFAVWVTEAGTVYLASTDTVYQVHSGELEACVSFDKGGYVHLGDGVVFYTTVEDGVRMIELRTYGGELIYQGEVFPEPVEGFGDTLGQYNSENRYTFVPMGVDVEKLIVCMTGDDSINHLFLLEIHNGMKATHLWSGSTLLGN